ncbi:DUF4097 domain-containing protein [Balneola sp. MJW-20]|uniref:DUF4097 family beta strand repeat-containing protein n=1 Tax=Gracilimonas aurantiaca TaxID=3234185 RepID=UPI003465FB32
MKKLSWEIIIAGFLFVGLSIYLIEKNSQKTEKTEFNHASSFSQEDLQSLEKRMVIELENFEALKEDSLFKGLEQLEDLEKLEKIKRIMAFLPAEVKEDLQMNIDLTIDEIENESSSVNIKVKNGQIIINPKITQPENAFWKMESAGVYSHSESFDASDIQFTDLEFPYGSIQVVGTDESSGNIIVQASGDFGTSANLEELLHTKFIIENGRAIYRVSEIKDTLSKANVTLQTIVKIPRRMDIRSSTGGGHIEVKDIAGEQQLETEAGHITLSNVTGLIEAKTLGGHIKAYKTSGKADLHTLGGHVSLTDSECEASLRSEGGNLWVSNVTGPVNAVTKAGNIQLRQGSLSKNMTLSTGTGNIDLLLDPGLAFDLDLKARGIELSPVFGLASTKSGGSFSGMVNSGGPLIKASTGYGTVTLKKNE